MRIETPSRREVPNGTPGSFAAQTTSPGVPGQAIAAGGKALPVRELPVVADVRQAAERIEQFLRESKRQLTISVDEPTGHTVVVVRDGATGALIRQIPSEEALRIAHNLESLGAALLSEVA